MATPPPPITIPRPLGRGVTWPRSQSRYRAVKALKKNFSLGYTGTAAVLVLPWGGRHFMAAPLGGTVTTLGGGFRGGGRAHNTCHIPPPRPGVCKAERRDVATERRLIQKLNTRDTTGKVPGPAAHHRCRTPGALEPAGAVLQLPTSDVVWGGCPLQTHTECEAWLCRRGVDATSAQGCNGEQWNRHCTVCHRTAPTPPLV